MIEAQFKNVKMVIEKWIAAFLKTLVMILKK